MSKFETTVAEAFRKFYYEHHDKDQIQADLVRLLESERSSALSKVLEGVSNRLNGLRSELFGMKVRPINITARINELESLQSFVVRLNQKQEIETPPPPPDQL